MSAYDPKLTSTGAAKVVFPTGSRKSEVARIFSRHFGITPMLVPITDYAPDLQASVAEKPIALPPPRIWERVMRGFLMQFASEEFRL
jgi:hypothetical protein